MIWPLQVRLRELAARAEIEQVRNACREWATWGRNVDARASRARSPRVQTGKNRSSGYIVNPDRVIGGVRDSGMVDRYKGVGDDVPAGHCKGKTQECGARSRCADDEEALAMPRHAHARYCAVPAALQVLAQCPRAQAVVHERPHVSTGCLNRDAFSGDAGAAESC